MKNIFKIKLSIRIGSFKFDNLFIIAYRHFKVKMLLTYNRYIHVLTSIFMQLAVLIILTEC